MSRSILPFITFSLSLFNKAGTEGGNCRHRLPKISEEIRRKHARVVYLDHVESDGRLLFEEVVKMDLEGIVCKRKDSPYKVTYKPYRYWIKVKNSRYSQLEGREELFESR